MEKKAKKQKKPWPTKEAMEQVYELGLWGKDTSNFYSGIGSHHSKIVDPYIEAIRSFLTSFNNPIVVCDLGCGDFNVGKRLVKYTDRYIAVDIVEDLIECNKSVFEDINVEFHCLDIAIDKLPSGDCALIRQVLQHLSNMEVQSIVNKLSNFKYVIITEHLPAGDFIPNIDILSGQGTRLKKQSGLNVLEPPFNLKAKCKRELLSVHLDDYKGVIITTLYEIF